MQWFGVGHYFSFLLSYCNLIELTVTSYWTTDQFNSCTCWCSSKRLSSREEPAVGCEWIHGGSLPSVVPVAEANGKCWWRFLLLNCEEFTSGWYTHKQVIIQLDCWTHSDSFRVFLPNILYFSGWYLLCRTSNNSNFHTLHIHHGFPIEFLILTFYCLFTLFENLFFSFVWCQLQWLRRVLVLLHHM